MKTQVLFAAATFSLACSLVAFFACQKAGSKPETAKAEAPKTVPAFIDPGTAQAAINRWNQVRPALIGALPPSFKADSSFILRGFHVNLHDLTAIVNNIGDTTQIFTMLGIRTDANGTPRMELFFQAPDRNGVVRYHDFTLPCPRNCPD